MADPALEALLAQCRVLGLSEDMIQQAKQNPQLMKMLKEMAEKTKDKFLPQAGFTTEGNGKRSYKHLLDVTTKAYEREKNEPLRKPAQRDRYTMLSGWEAQRQSLIDQQRKSPYLMRNSFIGIPKESSSKTFDQLKRINFEDMFVSKTHKGYYLICRSISHAQALVGVSLFVEDPKGRAEPLGMYNLDVGGVPTGPDLEEWLPLGTLLAIKEPTFKTNVTGESYLVRVESPTDVVFLRPDDPLLSGIKWSTTSPSRSRPASFDYRSHGNSFFKVKKFNLALKSYSDGLAVASNDSSKLLLLLNRSQTHLKLDHPNQALQDAEAALRLLGSGNVDSTPQLLEKAKLRKSKALEGRRLLEKALESYEDAEKEFKESKEAKEGVERLRRKLREARTGEYDWAKLAGLKEEHLDVGDYTGPMIEVREVANVGGRRGIFAKKDLKPGDLLLVEKAFATGESHPNDTSIAIDFRTKNLAKASSIELVTKTMTKMIDDPSTAASVYGLYGGSNHLPTGQPRFHPLDPPAEATSQVLIDAARVEAIVSNNSFDITDDGKTTIDESLRHDEFTLLSKFPLQSLLPTISTLEYPRRRHGDSSSRRHSSWTRGLSYCPVQLDYNSREQIVKGICEVQCNCSRCVDDRKATPTKLTRRKKLLDVQFASIEKETDTLDPRDQKQAELIARKLSRLIASLEMTYTSSTFVRPELSNVYHLLTELLHPIKERSQLLLYVSKSLQMGGVVFDRQGESIQILSAPWNGSAFDGSVNQLLMHARRLSLTGKAVDMKEARGWVRAAVQLDKLMTGREKKDFYSTWAEPISQYGIVRLVNDTLKT